jgi:hypothetical protein
MGMETVVLKVTIGTCLDSMPIDGPRLRAHVLKAMVDFAREEYKTEPHLWEVEKIDFGWDWEFETGGEAPTLYDLREEVAKRQAEMISEGGHEMVGEIGLD